MGRLFGTNGVRGVLNQEFTVELAQGLAASAGSLLGKEMAVGRDARTSSPMVRDAVVSGLLSVGCNVHDMGALPTPTLQYMVKHLGLDGGVMVTASHNPPQFNGVKVMAADGVEISRATEDRVEELYFKGGPQLAAWNLVGVVREVDVVETYIGAVIDQVDRKLISSRGLKVALDTGNGVSCLVAPRVASRLGAGVYTVNAELDGGFPGRGSEPTPENLGALRDLIEATGADLGIGFDGDGDRSIIMDEKGEAVWGDKSLSLIADWYLGRHPGETVVTSISTSKGLEDVVNRHGGRVHWVRVGSVDVSRAMVENGYLLGGEENGGIMYGPHHPVRDGAMVMALLLQILAERRRPLSELIAEQPIYSKAKDKVECPNELKLEVLGRLPGLVEGLEVDTMDGVKVTNRDGSWILIRPSGTEPVCRLYAEARDEEAVRGIIGEYKEKLSRLIEDLKQTV
ncbi:MAG TPA: phosphoglucosamine mutase [Candidatus Desulfaltia sp.]|nr:phosphoglucosamine mutase [Candidatus Desulfaltia sp.]